MRELIGWAAVPGVLLAALGAYEWSGAAQDSGAMPPFLVLFLIAQGVVAFVFTWRHAIVLFVTSHLFSQFVLSSSSTAFDLFGGNPAVVLRVVSFAVAEITIIALVSELKRQLKVAEESRQALVLSEAQFRGLISQAPMPITVYAMDGTVVFWNDAVTDLFKVQQRSLREPYNLFEDENIIHAGLVPAIKKALAGTPMSIRDVLFQPVTDDFQHDTALPRWLDVDVFPIKDTDGKVLQLALIMNDVTREKDLLSTLEQSQKLESIGQLSGGVAHDFNNLLMVILGNLELVQSEIDQNHPGRTLIDQATSAANRGADLTRKLLAFSRKQPLEPKPIDARLLISGMHEMLARTLGEDIAIEVIGGAGLWRCEADAGQLENVLLNLAINARDAMENGGRLTIETSNTFLDDVYAEAHPGSVSGQYVMLAVSDTGCGMTAEVKGKAFEPFFSTKETGKGSGLGLSMAFGFVQQSRGYIEIYSEVDDGTTVKVYLPRTGAELVKSEPEMSKEEPQGAGETVLVVEDDDGVRALTMNTLGRLGYRALSATNAQEALELLNNAPEVEAILTDVILPGGLNGAKLAEKALALRPDLKVLYMSGYTENAIIHDGKLDPGVDLLQKPYTKLQLAKKLHKVLRR